MRLDNFVVSSEWWFNRSKLRLNTLERKTKWYWKAAENQNLLRHNSGISLPSFFPLNYTPNDGECKLDLWFSNVFLCSSVRLSLWGPTIVEEKTNTKNNWSSSKENWCSLLVRKHLYTVFKAEFAVYNSKNNGNMNQLTLFPVNLCNNELNRM